MFFFFLGEVDQLVGRHNHGNLLMPPKKGMKRYQLAIIKHGKPENPKSKGTS